jgi:hypothetical protein
MRTVSGRGTAVIAATVGGYAGLLAWLTWPLAARLATHLPRTKFICDFDLRQMIWALAWQSHALTTAPRELFEANIYHPTPHALLYADAGLGALPYFLPIFRASGNPVLASNLLFLGGLVATAAALHLVVARWTGLHSAGFVAAGTLLATPWVLWTWIPAAPNYAVLFLLPGIVLLAAQPSPTRRDAWLLAALLVLHGAANPYYAASALASVAVIAAARLATRATRPGARHLLGALVVATVALAVVYAPWAWLRIQDPALADRVTWKVDRLLPRLVPMALPSGLLADPRKPAAVPWPLFVLVGLGALARWVPGATRQEGERTAWRHGLVWIAVGLLLSLMPAIEVLGRTIRVPFVDLVDRLPLVATLREPYRIGVGALFGIAIVAGAAFAEVARRLGQGDGAAGSRAVRGAVATACVLAGFACTRLEDGTMPWRGPYPLAEAPGPSSITAVLARPGGAVLELPVDGLLVDQLTTHARAMFQSIRHWRPLVNGYGGFYPAEFVERMQLAARLPDATALAELRRTTGLEHVVVHGAATAPRALDRWEELARRGGGEGLRFVMRDGPELLFVVSDATSTDRPRGP